MVGGKERDHIHVRAPSPEPTVIHFHGPKLPNSMDGVVDVTQQVIQPGQTFTYEFVAQPGGMISVVKVDE